MKKKINQDPIDFSVLFNKNLRSAPIQIKIAFRETLEIFLDEPFHPQLRNHPLTGRYSGYRSIDVTGDWRAIYIEIKDKDKNSVAYFVALGTHPQLYRR